MYHACSPWPKLDQCLPSWPTDVINLVTSAGNNFSNVLSCRPGSVVDDGDYSNLKAHDRLIFLVDFDHPRSCVHCVGQNVSAGNLMINTSSGRGHAIVVHLRIGPFI